MLPRALGQAAETHRGGLLVLLRRSAQRQHDADRLLHALKDAGADRRLVSFGRAVDHVDLVRFLPQVGAHLLKARPVQEPDTVMKQTTPRRSVHLASLTSVPPRYGSPPKTFQAAQRQK